MFGALVAMVMAGGARAQEPGAEVEVEEPVGTWRFRADDRPIKVVVIGGSVSAWPKGSFGQFVEAVCPRVEVVNRGKARLGALQLKRRFARQVLDNRRIDPKSYEAMWLLFNGGLNSIGTPEQTNRRVADILKAARREGIHTIALSVGPWGDESDRRWRGPRGLHYQDVTRLAVDYLMGRVPPETAFGPEAAGRTEYEEGELPDIAVDIYDSPLRDRDAALRDEELTRRQLALDREVRARLADVPEAERDGRLEALVQQARELPRWYLRKELRAFDHIHPNIDGHRIIAETMCPKLPEAWGCQCASLPGITWSAEARGLAPEVQAHADSRRP
ncbi:MAG: SGNH/GDSL hydrolase family protein [Deltaproteobacteria bacterium]|nr:SGNH/GDSL hydrolase family protein [Deltaproteobacteria bacterium]MCB9789110.1 SGNH/GDSL hydrolase family protein [Deltaproteobacteria bacterium]